MPPSTEPPTLVIQTAFLGDVILTLPLLSSLADRHGPVDVLAVPAAEPLLVTHPAVRAVIRYDKSGNDRGLGAFLRVARRLRSQRYGRVYLAHRSFRSGLLALLARIPERIGFDDAWVRWSYTARVPRHQERHESERLLGLAGPATGRVTFTLGLTPADREAADRWLTSHGIPEGFVVLAPGSVWGTKRWPYFPDLARRLSRPVVVIGGAQDAAVAAEILGAAARPAASGAGRLSLRESAAVLERAHLLVTNDSAPLHLGTATSTPTVAIFGPTVPAFGFGPRGAGDVIVEHDSLPCRPCSHHGPARCPLGHHRCMRDLGAEVVLAAVERVLVTQGASRGFRHRD